jgi:DnaJ family protein B protein 6
MSDPFFADPWRRGRNQSFDVHRQRGRGFFDDHLLNAGFPFDRGFDDMMNPGGGRSRVYSQVSRSTVTPDGRFVSESRMTRTVNGVTESVWKRKDAAVCPLLRLEIAYADVHCLTQGNEYATYTYPDGRERHTVNGREQPPKHIQARYHPSPPPSPPPPIQTTLPPPPPYSNISRKRESPTSVSGRKRDSPSREHHSPIEILSSSHSGSPPPIGHHYRGPPTTGMSPLLVMGSR